MAGPAKIDVYKQHKSEYVAPRKPVLIETRPAKYLSITGRGEPGGEAFLASVGAMYPVAFTIKMTSKFAGRDYRVCHLEGLWWGRRETGEFFREPRSQWNWQLLMRVPEFIGSRELKAAHAALAAKGKGPMVQRVQLESIDEGRCVQMLHVGPYATEPASIEQMLALARAHGLEFRGKHHEIYLSDPRRVTPERLRTILRHPVG